MLMNDSSKGLFLVFMVLLCNFLGETMSCSVQIGLKEHPTLKWFCIFVLIFFTINFTSNPQANPLIIAGNSFLIFLLFILFMKQHKITFFPALLILMCIFSLNQWITYFKNKEPGNEKKIENLQYSCLAFQLCFVVLLILGTLINYRRSKKHGLLDFFFSANICPSLHHHHLKKNIKNR